jgi:beta-glucosidase
LSYKDCICKDYYGEPHKDAQYREGIYVGYRYYETAGVKVRFPFGYGLSYTKFTYGNLQVDGNRIFCEVTNVGNRSGKEIIQLYIEPIKSTVHRPLCELKGFEKVELAPGESKVVSFTLDERSFSVWEDGWKIPTGDYKICISKNCQEPVLVKEVHIEGEKVFDAANLPNWYRTMKGVLTKQDLEMLLGRKIVEKPIRKGEFTKGNTVMEMKEHSLLMKLLYFGMETVMARKYGGRDYSNTTFKMMMTMAMDCSVSGMQINGGIKGHLLQGMVEIANGRFLQGIKLMMKK